MLDTNKLLADTLEQQDLYQQHVLRQQKSMTLRSDIISEGHETYSTPYNVNESVDSGMTYSFYLPPSTYPFYLPHCTYPFYLPSCTYPFYLHPTYLLLLTLFTYLCILNLFLSVDCSLPIAAKIIFYCYL